MLETWIRAITHPSQATFRDLLQQAPDPTFSKGANWIALAGLIAGIVQGLQYGGDVSSLVCAPVSAVIAAIVFGISSMIILVIAQALGGDGDLDSQSYLLAAVQAPMTIISAVLGTVSLFSLLAGLYTLALTVIVLQAVHDYGMGKAILSLVLPGMIIFVLALGYMMTFGLL